MMNWPKIEQIAAMVTLPEGFRFDSLARCDIPALVAALRQWHPDIAVGGGSCYLREDFYTEMVGLKDEKQKGIFVGLFRCGDELAGMWSWEQEPDARSLYGRLIVISPKYRSAKLATTVMPIAEAAGRLMGAEFLFAFATMKIPHAQRALESVGFQLIGFTSGYDREEVAPGVIKRVFEAAYCKSLVQEDELVRPDRNQLTPRTQALFDVLFPDAANSKSLAVDGSKV
jgi:hypothetical protein